MDLDRYPSNDPGDYILYPREYSLHLDKDNDTNNRNSLSPRTCWSSDHRSSSSGSSTKMTGPAPFEVPKVWQTAMSMVSINAGLFPQEVLTQYQRQQPTQKLQHPSHTELDMTGSKRAHSRGIKAVTIRYADDDPGNIYLMVIFIDQIDPRTRRDAVRLITNTSIKHVLEADPGANCPLWLPTQHSDFDINHASHASHTSSPFQILPCCEHWIEDLDLARPISNEEKQVPAVVDRLLREIKRKDLMLAAKDREVQDRDEELARLRSHARSDEVVAHLAAEQDPRSRPSEIEALVQQYWLVGFAVVVLLIALFALK